jgi:hypothetical protein
MKKRLMAALVAVVMMTAAAYAWDCEALKTDDWKDTKNLKLCGGCFKAVPHIHSLTVPMIISVPGQNPSTVYRHNLCCLCWQRVLIGKGKLTRLLDLAGQGAEYEKALAEVKKRVAAREAAKRVEAAAKSEAKKE